MDWLTNTRTSYDAVATGYAAQMRDSLTEKPYVRGMVPVALAHFRRVVRPGGVVMLGFHEGNGTTHKTNGYGGNPMDVYLHRRPPARVAAWLNQAGFTVEARVTLDPSGRLPGAVLFAR